MSEIAQAPSAPDALEGYDPGKEFYDEAFSAAGAPRPHYEGVLGALSRTDLQALSRAVTADASARGVTFGTSRGAEPFAIDPVPRLIAAREWKDLEAGLAQRVRALNAFIADVYADRGIFEAGLLPEGLLEGAVHLEPEMTGVTVPGDAYAVVAGLDLVRAPDGRLLVLEDNLRTPSGLSYAVAAGEIVEERLPAAAPDAGQSLDHAYELLGAALRAAAPDGRGDPSIVLLSDGPQNSAWYEHKQIARHLGLPIVTLADLDHSDGRLFARTDRERRRVDVVYRRTDDERLRDEHGRLTAVAQALLEPMRRGRLTCVNAFGTGIADDKLTHAYSDRIVRFYLGEEPLLESATSYDLGQPEMLDAALERLDELVIKPRTGHGGKGVVVCARASPQARDEVASILRDHPADYVAQELVRLSRHPTVVDGRLEPRHVDLRPFALSAGKDVSLVPGGLTRVAFDSESWWSTPREGEEARPRGCLGERRAPYAPQAAGHGVAGMSGEGPSIEQRVGVAAGTPPLIGVSNSELRSPSRVEQLPEGEPPQREIGLGLAYPQAIQRAGGLPVVLPALEPDSVLSLLDRLHGLCLSGGPDLEPSNYARPPHPRLGPTEPEVDRYELALARHADERGMPILAICRGAQVLNVARGGTLHQHLPEVSGVTAAHRQAEPADRSTHQVEVSPESLLARALAGSQRLEVNSFHHQAPERLGDGLRAVAWSTDGVVEGIEAPGREFMVGVQWHAECLLERPEQAALFRSFVEAAARYGAAVDRAHAA